MPSRKRSRRKISRRKKPGSRSGPGPKRSGAVRKWIRRLAGLALAALAGYTVYLDITVRQKFEGSRWSIPSHVYSRPLELYTGLNIAQSELTGELGKLGYRSVKKPGSPGSYAETGHSVRIYIRGLSVPGSPSEPGIVDVRFERDVVAALHGADGKKLETARLEARLYGSISTAHHEDRSLVRRIDVPDHLVNALLAIEDKAFFSHFGIDPRGLARALWANITAGAVVQGGSTLTQQLVKNFYLSREKTVQRKLTEILMAILLEVHYTKDEILEAYINEVYLGQSGNRAIHGFGLASQFYFGQPLNELKIPELALLAALVKGASYYNPFRSPQRATQRRNLVLSKMAKIGYLDAATAAAAQKAPLGVTRSGTVSTTDYPAYLDFVRLQLRRDYQEGDLRNAGLHIYTTLDPIIQAVVEKSIGRKLSALERQKKLESGVLQSAVLVVRTDNGEVVALSGGRNPGFAGFNRALEAERPIGSLIKPVVFLSAFELGYSLASVVDDNPLIVKQAGAPVWKPGNYDGKSHGSVRLIDALSYSYNIATARLGLETGVDRVVNLLRRLGLNREVKPYPSLLLGAVNMTPIEMTQLYLGFASGGFLIPLRTTRLVLSQDLQPLARYPLSLQQVIESEQMTVLNAGLQSVVTKGTAKTLNTRFPRGLGLAGKTGTTDGYRDSWFAGYAGNYLTVVWVGRDDNKPTRLTGASGALQLWGDIMTEIHVQPVDLPAPASIEYAQVDSRGQLATGCSGATTLPFAHGTVPDQIAPCVNAKIRKKKPERDKSWLEKLFDTDGK